MSTIPLVVTFTRPRSHNQLFVFCVDNADSVQSFNPNTLKNRPYHEVVAVLAKIGFTPVLNHQNGETVIYTFLPTTVLRLLF